jgi:hypothetical protein
MYRDFQDTSSSILKKEQCITKVFYLSTGAQESCFKRILKFTLKQFLHVSVQSPSSGSLLFELAKVSLCLLVSLCLQANAETVPKFPSCYYMPLM